MRHVWEQREWECIPLSDAWDTFMERAQSSPKLGDLSVRDLCCLAQAPWLPVGIYVFSNDDTVLYTGKTHGRSFHERMLSHLDHRDPISGSPHLAQLAQSILKKGDASSACDSVQQILDMKMTWLPILRQEMSHSQHKHLIALIERRLLWNQSLDPLYNSPRVKKNETFQMGGFRYQLSPDMKIGGPANCGLL